MIAHVSLVDIALEVYTDLDLSGKTETKLSTGRKNKMHFPMDRTREINVRRII